MRFAEARLRWSGNKNVTRKHTVGSCIYTVIISNELGSQWDHAEPKRKIVEATAGRIPKVEKEALVTTYMGRKIFLRNSRGSRSKNDRRIYREAEKGRRPR